MIIIALFIIMLFLLLGGSILASKFGFRKVGSVLVSVTIITLLLQYGAYPFLDEFGKAELIMWQVISLPIIFLISLSVSLIAMCIWHLIKRKKSNHRLHSIAGSRRRSASYGGQAARSE
jgi:O-antigen ligase